MQCSMNNVSIEHQDFWQSFKILEETENNDEPSKAFLMPVSSTKLGRTGTPRKFFLNKQNLCVT